MPTYPIYDGLQEKFDALAEVIESQVKVILELEASRDSLERELREARARIGDLQQLLKQSRADK